jgi:NAD(P)-dependent dehydrogenase (short-subunit alcohol dehydrogenase family)
MSQAECALIVGVGPGLGAALARRFAQAGMSVALAARRPEKLEPLVREIGPSARAYGCDATDEAQVTSLFTHVGRDLAEPGLVVFNASGRVHRSIVEIGAAEFEQAWRNACLGGFLVGREAVRLMLPKGRGTILFTGATASIKGYALSAGFAVGKFGLRALSQSMARELGPKGIHVAHVIIDGGIDPGSDATLDPDAIAETYHHLHAQHRSAWTQEIDLRPSLESF